jgi:hypothetical protein
MSTYLQSPAQSTTFATPSPATTGELRHGPQPHGPRSAVRSRRGFRGRTIGFWAGAVVGAAAGCFFGASMKYEATLAVTFSVIWWGIYGGCLGCSVGALFGLGGERLALRK